MAKPDWDTYFMNIADVVKTRSPDTTKVGAVLVSIPDHRIISTGYNSVCANMPDAEIDWSDRENIHKIVIHAEANAILYSQSKYDNAVLYCTLSPCKDCVKLLSATNIRKVIYKNEYRDFETARELCNYFGIEVTKHQS